MLMKQNVNNDVTKDSAIYCTCRGVLVALNFYFQLIFGFKLLNFFLTS